MAVAVLLGELRLLPLQVAELPFSFWMKSFARTAGNDVDAPASPEWT